MKIKTIEGNLQNNNYKFAIIASRFNDFVVSHLINGAVDALERHDVRSQDIEIIRVPGAFELPKVTKIVAKTKKIDGIICLGALIRGDTYHFDVLANEVAKGLAQIDLEAAMPISFGILTTDTVEQAVDRAGCKSGNKGADAALACLEMINLAKML